MRGGDAILGKGNKDSKRERGKWRAPAMMCH